MKHLHWEIEAGPEDVMEVTLNGRANVLLLDPPNFDNYQRGEHYRYHGGFAEESPMRLVPPSQGRWHVVVDLGGYPGHVRAGVLVFPGVNSEG